MIKKIKLFSLFFLSTIILGLFQVVTAHAPLSGEVDNESLDTALVLTDPLKSWVIYKELNTAGEANYYKFELEQNDKLSTNLLIPISEEDPRPPLRSGRSKGGAVLVAGDFGAAPHAARARPADTAMRALRQVIAAV